MDGSFASRLAEQRKLKKVSQKEAASALGVSQALLSHYENGIRECGLDFVVRAADYYGVSCDYLLGHTSNPLEFDLDQVRDDVYDDSTMSNDTVFRAALLLSGKIQDSSNEDAKMHMLEQFSLNLYLILWQGIRDGVLPESWAGMNLVSEDQIEFMMLRRMQSLREAQPVRTARDEPSPEAVSTLASWFYDRLNMELAELL